MRYCAGGYEVLQSRKRVGLKDEKIILFVGQLDKSHHYKGLKYLIQAMKIVSLTVSDVKLVVAGKGNNINHYKQLVKNLDLEKYVMFTGFVDDEDLPYFYRGSDVVVLPSTDNSEGFGMVLAEAMACGTAVIGSDVGGIPYLINHNENGLLVPKRDMEKLADSIIRVLQDKELRSGFGMSGRRRVKRELTWEDSIRKTEKIMETMK